MKIVTKISLLLATLPCYTFALGLNSYFQQGFEINNLTQQAIIASDTNTAISTFQNVEIAPYNGDSYGFYKIHYASDQFTNPAGQTFTRAVNIYSKNNNNLICTITGTLALSGDGSVNLNATSSEGSKCATSHQIGYESVGGKLALYYTYEVYVTAV